MLAFTAAIEIDPRQPDPYLKLAEAYLGLDDPDSARKTLEDGLAATGGDTRLQSKLNELDTAAEDGGGETNADGDAESLGTMFRNVPTASEPLLNGTPLSERASGTYAGGAQVSFRGLAEGDSLETVLSALDQTEESREFCRNHSIITCTVTEGDAFTFFDSKGYPSGYDKIIALLFKDDDRDRYLNFGFQGGAVRLLEAFVN